MIVFPMIINANKKENEEDIIDRLSKDPKGFIPSPIKRMGKLGITHLMLSIKDFLKRFDKMFYIQKEYNLISKSREHGEFSKGGNIKENFGRVQFLYPVIVKDLKLAKGALLKKGIDVKKEYCVDISNGFCENAKFLEEHVLCIPFHEGINRKEINIVKSKLKTLVIS